MFLVPRSSWVVWNRQESVPVWISVQRKVIRSAMAARGRGSLKIESHSLNGKFTATAVALRSSRSVTIWNSGLAPFLSRSPYPMPCRLRAACGLFTVQPVVALLRTFVVLLV